MEIREIDLFMLSDPLDVYLQTTMVVCPGCLGVRPSQAAALLAAATRCIPLQLRAARRWREWRHLRDAKLHRFEN